MIEQTKNIAHYAKKTTLVIAIVFSISLVGFFLVGQVYNDLQSRMLLDAIAPSLRTLCFAVITASATVIPLLMTMISLANRTERDFDPSFYIRIRIITFLGTVAIVAATLLLLVISIPITETDGLHQWYGITYVAVVTGASTISALLVGIVVTLYETIGGLLEHLIPKFD